MQAGASTLAMTAASSLPCSPCLVANSSCRLCVATCRLSSFNRQKLVDVAVATRHTVALLDDGCVFSWGSNLQGQLGYGTSDSASNATPRIVEAMKVGGMLPCHHLIVPQDCSFS